MIEKSDISIKENFSYDYYNLDPTVISNQIPFSNFKLEKLKPNKQSQKFITKWYNDFNNEMGSTWKTPDINLHNNYHFYVLRNINDEIVAAAANTLPSEYRFWFGRFYVWPKYRGSAASQELLNQLVQIAKLKKKDLSLLVHTDNITAIKLYTKYGFKKVSEVKVIQVLVSK